MRPQDIVKPSLCIGCGSCSAAMHWDRDGFLKPDAPGVASSERFPRQCPFSPAAPNEDEIARERFAMAATSDPRIGRFEAAYVGHAVEDPFRRNGSSGGLTSWVAAELLRTGAVDAIAHVAPADPHTDGRFFGYTISRSLDELSRGAKSRYYPVELSSVLREIRETPGRYAIVGVPCFIKAIHLLRRIDPLVSDRVTHTLGLFCGHMKSAAMVESFAWQLGGEIGRVRALDYRIKDESRPANWYRAHLELDDGSAAAQDWWHLADGDWGAGFFQNPACDWSDDLVGETADVSFGDAWVEPYSSDGRGTNVMPAPRTRAAQTRRAQRRSAAAPQARLSNAPRDRALEPPDVPRRASAPRSLGVHGLGSRGASALPVRHLVARRRRQAARPAHAAAGALGGLPPRRIVDEHLVQHMGLHHVHDNLVRVAAKPPRPLHHRHARNDAGKAVCAVGKDTRPLERVP